MAMKKKVLNQSSEYWNDFEGELSAYYHFIWNDTKSIQNFIFNEKEFICRYKILAIKYGIAVPINDIDFKSKQNLFSSLYELNEKKFYPTKLFINVKEQKPHKIISINPLLSLSESHSKFSSHGSIPFRVELLKKEKEIKLLCYIDNDAFNLKLTNKKNDDFGYYIDNSELAYLNTPRLNSYLKSLKALCNDFKMDIFKFEDLGLDNITEDGILFDNEIIYYEDISHLFPPEYQIVK